MKTSVFSKRLCAPVRFCASFLAVMAAFPASSALAQGQTEVVLKEVVVTATRFTEPVATLPFGVSVITAEDIQTSGATSVNEAVMKLLGVPGRLDTSGGNNYTLDLRGFGVTADSNQVVIVDGLRLNEADLSTAGLSSIPIDSVERIEVLRGTGSVLYGEGATGGVIVVTTKAGLGVKRINSAQLYAATGSNGLQDVRANVVLASGGFSLDVAADDRRSEGHRENFSSVSNDLSVTGQWSNDWLRLGARAGQSSLDSGLPGSLTAAEYAVDPRKASTISDYGSSKKDNSGVFAEASVGDWQLAVDANQRSKKNMGFMWGGLQGYNVDASNYSLRARHEGKMGLSATNAFVIGYDQNNWNSVVTQSTYKSIGTVASADATAVYFKDDLIFISTGTRLSVGGRTEEIKKSEGSLATNLNETQNAWELGFSQSMIKDVMFFGRLGSSFRLPNVDEFSYSTPGIPLKAQTSRDLELGARWKLVTGQVELRWYRNDLNNEIGYDATATGPHSHDISYPYDGANINFDPTQRQGLELDVKQALNSSLNLRLNAALRQAKFTGGVYAGNEMALVPKQTLAVRADWHPLPGHTLDGGVNWVAEQSPDFANACKMPSYTTLDVRYAYQFGKAELALGVANLTDEKYYTQAYGCDARGVTTFIYPEAGRIVTASLRVKF